MVEGIQSFFNIAMDTMVLYPTELSQYNRIRERGVSDICDVYGIEHLLRLVCRIVQ